MALYTVVDIIRKNIRKTDKLIRFGGDEFVMLLPCDLGQEEVVSRRATDCLFDSLKKGLIIDTDRVGIKMTCGGAFYPTDTDDPTLLFSYADKALYAAKKAGKSCFKTWRELSS